VSGARVFVRRHDLPKINERTTAFDTGRLLTEAGMPMDVLADTSGHICLLEPERRILFAGDTLLLHISPSPLLERSPEDPTVRRKSLVEYLRTLDALESLERSEVWPGHGEPVLDPGATIRQIKEHHLERKERLAERLDDAGKSPFQLAREMWRNLEGFDNFLAVSEVVAHLDLLELEGGRSRWPRTGWPSTDRLQPLGTGRVSQG
jgi:hypothetical protein